MTLVSVRLDKGFSTMATGADIGQGGPHMTSSLEVTEIQEELVKLNLKVKTLSDRFHTCHDEADMEATNEEIRARLAQFRERLARLGRLAVEQRAVEAREMLLKDLASHKDQLEACQKQFRQANLECILRLQKRDRTELFGDEDSVVRRRGLGGQDADKGELIKESGRVTDSLASISRQLAATVERSAATVDELASSSGAVREVQDEFRSMGVVIGQSRKLINKYARRETTDMVLILFAFCFFFACVFYILRKRVLGPLDPFSLTWNAVTTLVNTIINAVMTLIVNSDATENNIDEEAIIH